VAAVVVDKMMVAAVDLVLLKLEPHQLEHIQYQQLFRLVLVENKILLVLHLILEHQSLLLVVDMVELNHHLPQVVMVDPVVVGQVVSVQEVLEQELVMISQDLRHLFLLLMVGVMMVVLEELILVLHLTVEVAVVVHLKQEQEHHKETMVVEVCNSPQHLEIPLKILEHLEK
jgi:hypothetical protein